jgi:hypothetical protein
MCDQVARPLLDRGAGGRSPGFLFPAFISRRIKKLIARVNPVQKSSVANVPTLLFYVFLKTYDALVAEIVDHWSADVTRVRSKTRHGGARHACAPFGA